jgi:hypothetical protein
MIARLERLFDHAELAVMASHVPVAPFRIDDRLADADTLRGQLENAELLGLRIEQRDRIGIDLVGPDAAGAVTDDRVRAGVAALRASGIP